MRPDSKTLRLRAKSLHLRAKHFLPPLHIAAFPRDSHLYSVERLAQQYLAGKSAGAGDIGGKVKHILLIRRSCRQFVEPFRRDNNVAGRTGHLALAGTFQRHAGGLGDRQHSLPFAALNLNARTVSRDKADMDQIYTSNITLSEYYTDWARAPASIALQAVSTSSLVV
jgi:hypothetical protein